MNSIIISEICRIPRSANIKNVERSHVALLPKWLTTYFSFHFNEIKQVFGVIAFLILSFGLNAQNIVESFETDGAILLNRCNDNAKIRIIYSVDSLQIGANTYQLKGKKVTPTIFGSVVSWEDANKAIYISFDSDGLSEVVVYSGKQAKRSIFSQNYIDTKAEFFNNRQGSR